MGNGSEMDKSRILVEPVSTLHRRLLRDPYAFTHLLDFVFHGVGWSNRSFWDCEIYFDVPRAVLPVDPNGRPGDVDMLVVPCNGKRRLWEDAAAIEVKSYRLRRQSRGKSPGDSGREQVAGLADMGFPFVELLHVVPIDAGGPEEHAILPVWETNVWMPRDAGPKAYRRTDLSGTTFFLRQRGRMQRLSLPECAGAKIFWLSLDEQGLIDGMSVGSERTPTRNPAISQTLIEGLPRALAGLPKVRAGYPIPRYRIREVAGSRVVDHHRK